MHKHAESSCLYLLFNVFISIGMALAFKCFDIYGTLDADKKLPNW